LESIVKLECELMEESNEKESKNTNTNKDGVNEQNNDV
jgi:hypothetical protein